MINDLIGPKPEPTPVPEFPTPWTTIGRCIYDANSILIDVVEVCDGDDGVRVAAFIAEAVNEKIARDSAPAPATLTDGDGDIWTLIENGKYRFNDEEAGFPERTWEEIASEFGISE